MGESKYDPACERIDTAIKGIWLLYRWGRWEVLHKLFPHMTRDQMEAAFLTFDLEYIQSYAGKITNEKQVIALMRCFPPYSVVLAATAMIGRYAWIMQDQRQHYYSRRISNGDPNQSVAW